MKQAESVYSVCLTNSHFDLCYEHGHGSHPEGQKKAKELVPRVKYKVSVDSNAASEQEY